MVKTIFELNQSIRRVFDLMRTLDSLLQNGGACVGYFSNERCGEVTSASFLAESSVQSPRKLMYFYYLIKYFPDQSIQKTFYLILKKEALEVTLL